MKNHTKSENIVQSGANLYEKTYKIGKYRAEWRQFVWKNIQNRRFPCRAAPVCMKKHTKSENIVRSGASLYEKTYKIGDFRSERRQFVWKNIQNRKISCRAAPVCMKKHTKSENIVQSGASLYEKTYKIGKYRAEQR